MNKLLATLVAGTFAVVASSAFAQAPAPAAAPAKPKYDEKSAQELSSNSATNPAQAKANVEKSKMDPKSKAKYDESTAQSLSSNSATDPAQAKANVAASKASGPREKMPDLKKLTKEQKQELYRQLQKESTGG